MGVSAAVGGTTCSLITDANEMDETTVESAAALGASNELRPPFLEEDQDGSSPNSSRRSSSEESSVDEKEGKKRKRGDLVPPWKLVSWQFAVSITQHDVL